jgi:hypothetical protein
MLCLRTSLKTFVDIAMHGSASHERRQSDVYKSIKTLDEQAEDLKLKGFVVSRSGLYLRLLPKRSSSLEGQRHVSTVPVKLIKAQNDHHAKHIDGFFSHLKFKKNEFFNKQLLRWEFFNLLSYLGALLKHYKI